MLAVNCSATGGDPVLYVSQTHEKFHKSIKYSITPGYGGRPSAADWGGGMSVVLRRGSTCPLSWMAAYRVAVPLAHTYQLPLPRL